MVEDERSDEMSNLVSRIRSAFVHPARRRLWLTVGSGGVIAAGLLARHGFRLIEVSIWSVPSSHPGEWKDILVVETC